MNWNNIYYPGKLLKALDIEATAIHSILRLGLPDKIMQFFGGIGDDLLCTTVARELKKRNQNIKIWIISKYEEVFLHNHDFSHVLHPGVHWKIWYSPLLRSRRLLLAYTAARESDSYSEHDISPTEHIISTMCKKAGIKGEIELKPYFHLEEKEKQRGRLYEKQIVVQCIGPDSGSAMLNKLWPFDKFQSTINSLKRELTDSFRIVQIGDRKDPLLRGVEDLRGETTIRESASILSQSEGFLGTVGFLMHLARAVDCRSVIIYGGREHCWQSGYSCNENLNAFIECAPCWKWNECDFERRCMQMITVEAVVDAVGKILANPRDLVVETVTI